MPLTYTNPEQTEAVIKDEKIAHEHGTPDGRTRYDRGLISCTSTLEVGPLGKPIRLNSYLLAAVSPFFKRTHFSEGCVRNSTPISLRELDYDAVLSVTGCFHSGCTKVTSDNIYEILKVALMFELDAIKEDCVQFLKDGFTTQNCLKTFNFAIKHELEGLEDCLEDFICHNFREVSQQAEFLQLEYQDVAWMAFCSEDMVDKETIINAYLRWVQYDVTGRVKHLPLDKMYADTFEIFCKSFAEGSVLRNNPESKDMYFKFCEAKMFELRGKTDFEDSNRENLTRTEEQQPCVPLTLIEVETSQSKLHLNKSDKAGSQEASNMLDHPTAKSAIITPSIQLCRRETNYFLPRKPIKKRILYTRFEEGQKCLDEYNFQTRSTTFLHRALLTRRFSALAYFDGIIFDIGGTRNLKDGVASSATISDIDVYLPGNVFPVQSNRLNLIKPRSVFASCICENYLYVIGGFQQSYDKYPLAGVVNYVERYRLDNGYKNCVWEEVNNLRSWRSALDVAVLGNKIFAIGGIGVDREASTSTSSSQDLASVEMFDTTQPTLTYNWTYVSRLNIARAYMKTAVIDNAIYAVGGSASVDSTDWRNRIALPCVEQYYPERNLWLRCSDMNHKRMSPVVFEDNNLMYAIGGNSVGIPSMEVYDPRIDHWMLCEWPVGLSLSALQVGFNSSLVINDSYYQYFGRYN